MKKFSAFLLTLIMLTASLAACDFGKQGGTEPPNTGETAQQSGEEKQPDQKEPSLDGEKYNAELHMQTYPGDRMLQNLYAEESKGDSLTEALYARQQLLKEQLGITLTASAAEGSSSSVSEEYMNSIKNKDGAIDLYIANVYVDVVRLIQGGYLRDFKTVDGLNLDADYWDRDRMETLALHDRYYLGYGDFCAANAFVIIFNPVILEEYEDQLTESVYDTVKNYRWTLDKMISLASLAYVDKTGDGKTADDTFGMTGQQWIPFIGFLHGSNISILEKNESGEYTVSLYNEENKARFDTLAAKLKAFAGSNAAYFRYRIEDTPLIKYDSKRTMMYLQNTQAPMVMAVSSLPYHGVLPYPMYDEAQKTVGYRHLNLDGHITVPSYSENINMVADALEVLNAYSSDVTDAVYERFLLRPVSEAPEDTEMLRMVWDSLCADAGIVYSMASSAIDQLVYALPVVTNPKGDVTMEGLLKKNEKNAHKAMEAFLGRVGKAKRIP